MREIRNALLWVVGMGRQHACRRGASPQWASRVRSRQVGSGTRIRMHAVRAGALEGVVGCRCGGMVKQARLAKRVVCYSVTGVTNVMAGMSVEEEMAATEHPSQQNQE